MHAIYYSHSKLKILFALLRSSFKCYEFPLKLRFGECIFGNVGLGAFHRRRRPAFGRDGCLRSLPAAGGSRCAAADQGPPEPHADGRVPAQVPEGERRVLVSGVERAPGADGGRGAARAPRHPPVQRARGLRDARQGQEPCQGHQDAVHRRRRLPRRRAFQPRLQPRGRKVKSAF
jgi:hypothetical protein